MGRGATGEEPTQTDREVEADAHARAVRFAVFGAGARNEREYYPALEPPITDLRVGFEQTEIARTGVLLATRSGLCQRAGPAPPGGNPLCSSRSP
jgi:hypothetical protein